MAPLVLKTLSRLALSYVGQFKMLTLICKDLNDFGSGYGLRALRKTLLMVPLVGLAMSRVFLATPSQLENPLLEILHSHPELNYFSELKI